MLRGGSSWRQVDPKATKPDPGRSEYIHFGAHIMILNAKVANSSGFPSSQVDPDTTRPFIMLGGTPLAILILPVN